MGSSQREKRKVLLTQRQVDRQLEKPAEERASEESFSLRAREVGKCVDVEKKMTSALKLQERKNQ